MNRRTALRATPRLSLLACALAATLPALAQNVGTGTRFTPVLGDASTLALKHLAALKYEEIEQYILVV